MKLKFLSKSTIILFVAFILMGCSKQQSNVTGWNYNDKKHAGFQVTNTYREQTPPGMVYIEGGSFTMGRTLDDVPTDWNNIPRRVTVASFYMDQYEISNLNWREYLNWMRLVFRNAPELIKRAIPDSTVWRSELAYNDPYIRYYATHVAYNNYPVVGVSWEQAMDYCLWRTDRVNEMELVKRGIGTLPDFEAVRENDDNDEIRKNVVFNREKYMSGTEEYAPEAGKKVMKDAFGDERRTNMSDGVFFLEFRLPTEAEWEFAAYGVSALKGTDNYQERKIYPWKGDDMRFTAKGTPRGYMQANYVRGRGDYMGISGHLTSKSVITEPVNAYAPNDFGLYNMAGNVNEWVYDVYRPLTSTHVEEYNAFRGNVYVSPIFSNQNTQDGQQQRMPEIDEYGRVRYAILDKAGNLMEKIDSTMAEYTTLDVRNYRDGDYRTSKNEEGWKMPKDPDASTMELYDPDPDSPDGLLATKLSNTVRVYKGGSWRDRAYWLNPSTRRYAEQTTSSCDIGFRCAMSRVGGDIQR